MPSSDFTVTFMGVGGSCAAGSKRRARYGSNTSCVLARIGGRPVIIDMGTGLVRLTDISGADILLSHFHYDHIEGMPSFVPFFNEGRFDIYARPPDGLSVDAALSDYMKKPYLPITYSDFKADIRCHKIDGARFTIACGAEIDTLPLPHPGGCTGFRIAYGGRALIYLCDSEHDGGDTAEFCAGCDLVIYDAHFTADEYASGRYTGWGHSNHEAGIALAEASGARRIAFTHHAVWRTDDELDALAENLRKRFTQTYIAAEDMEIEL